MTSGHDVAGITQPQSLINMTDVGFIMSRQLLKMGKGMVMIMSWLSPWGTEDSLGKKIFNFSP
jgi:hypothetical protein